jgi:hypothetical protein
MHVGAERFFRFHQTNVNYLNPGTVPGVLEYPTIFLKLCYVLINGSSYLKLLIFSLHKLT